MTYLGVNTRLNLRRPRNIQQKTESGAELLQFCGY